MKIFNIILFIFLSSCLLNPHELGFRSDIFNPDDLPSMVVWLDGTRYTSIRDNSGNNANNALFSGVVRYWDDVSGSANVHNFYQTTTSARPTFDTTTGYFNYDGVNDYFAVNNHADLNIATVSQRNLTVAIKTSNNITSRQMIYDEGGNIRGMNIFIFNGSLHCGFYNIPNDGDGPQPYVQVSEPITTNSIYFVSWVFDYTNYTGPTGPDGSLKCYVNGVEIGTATTTSRLFSHSGAIGIGAVNGNTVMENGVNNTGSYFKGSIMEVMIFNDPPTVNTITDVHRYLSFKWQD